MTPKVGVFSAVIAVSVGALAFKGVDIAQAFAVEPAPAAAPGEGAAAAGEGEEAPVPEDAPPAAPTPEQCLTTLNSAAEEMGLSRVGLRAKLNRYGLERA